MIQVLQFFVAWKSTHKNGVLLHSSSTFTTFGEYLGGPGILGVDWICLYITLQQINIAMEQGPFIVNDLPSKSRNVP